MELVINTMDPPHSDSFEPWLGVEDLELLRSVQTTSPSALPPSHYASYTMTPQNQRDYQSVSSTASSASNGSFKTLRTTHAETNSTTSTKPTMRQPSPCLSQDLSSPISTGAFGGTSSSASSPPASPPPKRATGGDEALMSVEELRREKNRQKVRRHYYRKLNLLNGLRAEVAQLEVQFQTLLKQNETPDAIVTSQQQNRLLEELSLSRLALERENEQLRQLYVERQSWFTHLQELLATEDTLFMTTQMAKTMFIKPLSLAECYAVRDKAVEDVMMLTSRPRRSFLGSGLAGWQDEVSVENGFWKFSLHKTFRNISAAIYCERAWPLLTDPNAFSRMYSSAVEAKCVIVQRVDDRNVVMFQECRAMDADNEYYLLKSLFLVSRVETSVGELMVVRGLGEDRLQDTELFLPTAEERTGQIVWHDIFTWTRFDRTGLYDQDCVVQFGGSAPIHGNNISFWSVEILNLVVRFECATCGVPFLLPSSNPDDQRTPKDNRETQKPRTPPVEVS